MSFIYNSWSVLFFKNVIYCDIQNKEEVYKWLYVETGCSPSSAKAPYTVLVDKNNKIMVRLLEKELAMRLKLMGF